MMVKWMELVSVIGVRMMDVLKGGWMVLGYGGKILMVSMIEYLGKWWWVYVMVYGNGLMLYVLVKGEEFILDVDI